MLFIEDVFTNKISLHSTYSPEYAFSENYPYRITIAYDNKNMGHFWGNNCGYKYKYDLKPYLDRILKCILSKGKYVYYN